MKLVQFSASWPLLLRCFVLFVGGALVGTGEALAAPDAPTRTSYTFPFTTQPYGIPAVQAKVNDRAVGTFLIDTGSSSNLITDTMVAKLGLKPGPVLEGKQPFLLDGRPAGIVTDLKLQVGPLTLQGGAYLVVSAKTLTNADGSAEDGIISMQMLRYFAPDIDFSRHQITMWYPNGLTDDEVKQAGFAGAASVSLSPTIPDETLYDPAKAAASADAYWNLVYRVSVQLDDGAHTVQRSLVLDTGSVATIFPADVSKSLKLKAIKAVKLPNIVYGAQTVDKVTAPILSLGDLRLLNHPVGVYRASSSKPISVLGVDVLSGYRLLMDFGAKRMYLKPNAPLPASNTPSVPMPLDTTAHP